MNLCLHGGVFAAVNSGSWFLQEMRHPFPEGSLTWVTSLWATLLLGLVLQVSAPGLLGLALFALIGAQLKVPEVREVTQLVVGRFRAR